jgi:anti-sigma28 factor (negative regulator of flagellin synthesis)
MKTLLNSSEMAKMLGITKQSFSDGFKSGRFTPIKKGKFGHPLFDPSAVKSQYEATRAVAELQDHARELPREMRGGRPTGKKNAKKENKPIDTQAILKAKHEKEIAQAKILSLKFKIQSGLYMEKAVAKKQGVELAEMVIGVLQSWPSRLAPELAAMRENDEHDFLQKIEKEVNTLIIAIRTQCGRAEREDNGQ